MTAAADSMGVVLSGTGGVWQVRTDAGRTLEASLRGRLKTRERRDDDTGEQQKLAVGDMVRVEEVEGGAWAICEIMRRRSQLARRAPGGAHGERVLAANLDQVIIVFAAAKPEPHARMLDRFLVIAEANEIPARIVVNKLDLVDEDVAHEIFGVYERAGYGVHYVSVKQRLGLSSLRAVLGGKTSVLTGPSGVGKSSLLNTLFPGLNLRVGEISESVQKGRHTTVGALMVPLPAAEGGYVVDTPGLREVGLWGLPSEHLDYCFPELRPLAGECRFGDCRHVSEPDCAVRQAVDSGDVSRVRYSSYLHLLEQLEAEG